MENVYTIEQIFSERLLVIPDYQRGYAWERQNLVEFTDDLEMLSPERSHYTGTVILDQSSATRRRDAAGRSYEIVDIVDGQQRLTTILVFLNALRRELLSLDGFQEMAAGIQTTYLATTGQDKQPLYKLTLNRDTHPYWVNVVLNDNPGVRHAEIRAEQRLAEAGAYFTDYLQRARRDHGNSYADWLQELYEKLTFQLKFTLYRISDADAGAVFEVMNARGKPLTDLELVKNYLLFAATKIQVSDHSLRDEVNTAWGDIFEKLMRAGLLLSEDENQFLRTHWLVGYDPQSQRWKGSKSIKATFSLRAYEGAHEDLLDELVRYIRSLREACDAYCEIENPRDRSSFSGFGDDKDREEAREATERFRRTGVTANFRPLLVAARLRYPHASREFIDLVRLCERFAFRAYLFLKNQNTRGQADLYRLANQLYVGEVSLAEAHQRVAALATSLAPQRRFETEFELETERDWYGWRGIRYFLYEYEEFLTGSKQVKLSWDVIDGRDKDKSIEHVLPQTPDDPYWTKLFTEEDIATLTHDIGNLSLTQDNSSLSNKPFPDKKGAADWESPCYANSLLLQERELAREEDWTPDIVRKRRQRITEWAKEHWRLQDVEERKETVEEEQPRVASGGSGAAQRHAVLTDEEMAISRVRPTTLNPWVIQPHNVRLYRSGTKGASGQCMSCTRSSVWSAKGTNKWWAFCSYHMSQWTGWENRAGIDEIPVTAADIALPSEWAWDRYLAEGYDEDHVETVRYFVEKLDQMPELEGRRFKLWIKFHPRAATEKTDRTKVVEITWYHSVPRLYVHRIGDVPEDRDPLPKLKGKKESRHWYWTLSPDALECDLDALVDFIRSYGGSADAAPAQPEEPVAK